jgi:predicted RNA-binding Zn-ribbon protein involved in translation (DUF1610 family)
VTRISYEEQFRSLAERYRKRMRLFIALFVCALLLLVAAVFGPDRLAVLFGVPGTVCVVAALATFFTKPTLDCSACGKSVENFDRFCPMCGAEALRRHQVTAAKCDNCRRTLGHYKYRSYKIHFCTHCGVLLDRRGV